MKYTIKEKFKMAKGHKEKRVPLHELAKRYNYDVTNVKYVCTLYEMQGEDAFINHGKMRRYSREEKLKAIDRVLNNNESR